MKRIVVVVLVLSSIIGLAQKPEKALTLPLIPLPKEVKQLDDEFVMTSKTKIVFMNDKFKPEVDYLNNYLKKNYGFDLQVINDLPKEGNYIIITKPDIETGFPENYDLTMNQNQLLFSAEGSAGLFYGIETLIQLMPLEKTVSGVLGDSELKIPCADIKDSPRFQWRGMHLDCSRHFFKKEEVEKYIDYLAMYKFNVFHWHLTDDQGWRIEIKQYPLLTSIGSQRKRTLIGRPSKVNTYDSIPYGGFYTQEDIKEIVSYASARHITIVPEIEMPGHSQAAIAAYPYVSCTGQKVETWDSWGQSYDVYCAGNDSTFLFLQNVLNEVCDLFPGKYIHIGGDECEKTKWKACPKCQNRIAVEKLKDENELQSYFITRIEKYLNSKGKQIIGWDEILDGGLAPNAAVMSWRGIKGGVAAAKQKHNVVMTPGKPCYFDHYQVKPLPDEPLAIGGYNPLDSVYSYNPTPKILSGDEAKFIMGAQGNVWTEYITDFAKVQYMSMPRMAALSEVLWTPQAKKDYKNFIERLKIHVKTLDKMNINYSKHFLTKK